MAGHNDRLVSFIRNPWLWGVKDGLVSLVWIPWFRGRNNGLVRAMWTPWLQWWTHEPHLCWRSFGFHCQAHHLLLILISLLDDVRNCFCNRYCVFGIVKLFWLLFEKNSLIKSIFYEVDFKKNWCLVKTVVEVVVLKKTVSCVWLKNCGWNCGRKKAILCLVKLWFKLWLKKIVSFVWLIWFVFYIWFELIKRTYIDTYI